MGLLDQVIGGVLGQVLGGGRGQQQGGGMGGGLGGAVSPIVQALLMLLMQKGMSGGLGDVFGGGERQVPRQDPSMSENDGDLGGFGDDRGSSAGRGGSGGGEFGDLAGMLDGPGGPSPNPRGYDSGAGPYSGLDRDPMDSQGGLDGLIERFQRGGLGDVMESWIGSGQNRPLEPNRLGEALGPQTIETLSNQTGLDRNTLLSQLAKALPGVIDGLTPQGRRPTDEDRRNW